MSVYGKWVVQGSKDPTGRGPLDDATHTAERDNPFCGDRVTVHLRIVDGTIEAASYDGRACAICLASAGRLVALLDGRPVADLADLEAEAGRAVVGEAVDATLEHLRDLVHAPTRKRCALLPFEAAVAAASE